MRRSNRLPAFRHGEVADRRIILSTPRASAPNELDGNPISFPSIQATFMTLVDDNDVPPAVSDSCDTLRLFLNVSIEMIGDR